jgi:hypothetical protein
MPPAGLEPTIPASKDPQTHASDRVATGFAPKSRELYSQIMNFTISHNTETPRLLSETGSFHHSKVSVLTPRLSEGRAADSGSASIFAKCCSFSVLETCP